MFFVGMTGTFRATCTGTGYPCFFFCFYNSLTLVLLKISTVKRVKRVYLLDILSSSKEDCKVIRLRDQILA